MEASQTGELAGSLNIEIDVILVTEPEPEPVGSPKVTNESSKYFENVARETFDTQSTAICNTHKCFYFWVAAIFPKVEIFLTENTIFYTLFLTPSLINTPIMEENNLFTPSLLKHCNQEC